MEVPIYLKFLFYGLVLICFAFIMSFFKKGVIESGIDREKGAKLQGKVMLFLIVWLMVLAILAILGFFQNLESLPPRPFFAVFCSLLALILLAKNKIYQQIAFGVPPQWILYFQTFRIPLEIWLWSLFINDIIPVQMTFEGYNFDIIPAIIGPLVAYLVFTKKAAPIWLAKAWNYFGILTVIVIVFIATVSMQSPLRLFDNEPSNTIITFFPYIWLPGFLVPMALLMHVTSLIQLGKKG